MMVDETLTEQTAITGANMADDDLVYVVDVSAASGSRSKKITRAELFTDVPAMSTSEDMTVNADILIEDGENRITYNDGGGNFNIRSGHYYDLATDNRNEYTTTAKGAIHVKIAHENPTPNLSIKLGEPSANAVAGAEVVWSNEFNLSGDGTMSWDGDILHDESTGFYSNGANPISFLRWSGRGFFGSAYDFAGYTVNHTVGGANQNDANSTGTFLMGDDPASVGRLDEGVFLSGWLDVSTTLGTALSEGVADTTVTVASTTGFPSSGLIRIGNELIAYTGTTSTTFTGCTRGYDPRTGAANSAMQRDHSVGAGITSVKEGSRFAGYQVNSAVVSTQEVGRIAATFATKTASASGYGSVHLISHGPNSHLNSWGVYKEAVRLSESNGYGALWIEEAAITNFADDPVTQLVNSYSPGYTGHSKGIMINSGADEPHANPADNALYFRGPYTEDSDPDQLLGSTFYSLIAAEATATEYTASESGSRPTGKVLMMGEDQAIVWQDASALQYNPTTMDPATYDPEIAQELFMDGDTNAVVINRTNAPGSTPALLDFRVGGTSKAYFQAATGGINIAGGDLGIGTTSPSEALDVSGNIAVSGTVDGVDIAGSINQDIRTTASPSFAGLTVDTSTLHVNGDTNRVGVGTTSPTAKFQVVNGADNSNTLTVYGGDTSSEFASMGVFGTSAYFTAGNAGAAGTKMQLRTADSSGVETTRMVIDSDGKVGIGTTSPDHLLHVNGDFRQSNNFHTEMQSAVLSQVSLPTTPPHEVYLGRVGVGVGTIRINTFGSSAYEGAEIHYTMKFTSGTAGAEHTGFEVSYLAFELAELQSIHAVWVSATQADIYIVYNNTAASQTLYWTLEGFSGVTSPAVAFSASPQSPSAALDDTNSVVPTLIMDNLNKRVGVGTLSPSQALHVNSGDTNEVALFESTDTTATVTIKDSVDSSTITHTNGVLRQDAPSSHQFYVGGSTQVDIKSNGVVRFIPQASAPGSPVAGDTYYDSTLGKLRCYNGSAWSDLF